MLSQEWFQQLPLPQISGVTPVSGGDINLAFRVTANGKDYFVKVQPNHPASYFDHEKAGLAALEQAVTVPHPVESGAIGGHAYLILTWVDEGRGDQYALGQAVAHLHQLTAPKFGFASDHTTKVLTKNNAWNPDWGNFYLRQRLEPEVAAARKQGVWNDWRDRHYQQMAAAIGDYYANHQVPVSLLHGDLWAGNFLFDAASTPVLIDPDAVYGDREFDLAMTTVFGGFDDRFYAGYQSVWPFEAGLDQRLPWYRFYYLCMHLILFGEGYGPSVDRILAKY